MLPEVPTARLEMVCRDAPADPGPGITILGQLTDAELATAYRRAWAFCLPSDYEGFGIPYAEAMASGVPVVATPNIGARYVTEDGADGILAPLERIGSRLRELLLDPIERTAVQEAGTRRAAIFDLRAVVDSYELLYRAHA